MVQPNNDGLAFVTAPSSGTFSKSLTNSQFMAYERMRINANGNVGIGTTSPTSMLSVKGDYGVNIEPLSGGPVNFYITSNSANNVIGVNARTKYGAWEIPDSNKPSSFLDFSTYNSNNPYYGGMAFFTRGGGTSGIGTEKLVI